MRSPVSINLMILLVIIIVQINLPQSTVSTVAAHQLFQAALGVAVNPSSIVVKVGEKANVTVTVINPGDVGQVCFDLEGFPESGFRTSFDSKCVAPRDKTTSILTVEATPAAAPQSFTALVIATAGSQTAQSALSVTVEPAMPAWIPWLGLVLFFLILGIAAFWRPRLPFRRVEGAKGHRRRR